MSAERNASVYLTAAPVLDAIPEWMVAICPDAHPSFGRPFELTIGGVRHVCATDGYMVVAIRSEAEARAFDDADLADKMLRALSPEPTATIAMADLRAIEPPAHRREKCGECNGTGEVECDDCKGSGEPDCDLCGEECDCACEGCDGDGAVDCGKCDDGVTKPELHLFAMGDAVLDARRLWKVLAHLSGDVVRVALTDSLYEPVLFAGDEWRIAIMQYVDDEGTRLRFELKDGVFSPAECGAGTDSAEAERDAASEAAKDGRWACDSGPSGAGTTASGRMAARKLPLGVSNYEGVSKSGRHQASLCHGGISDDPIHECVAMVFGDSEAEAMARAEMTVRTLNGLDALLSAAAKAIRVLDAEARPDASAPLREAVDAITGGRGAWRATVQIGASHCVVTGTWLDARREAASLLGVSAGNVTMRRVK